MTESGTTSDYKLKVTLPYFDKEIFNEKLKNANMDARVMDKQFCAGGMADRDTW